MRIACVYVHIPFCLVIPIDRFSCTLLNHQISLWQVNLLRNDTMPFCSYCTGVSFLVTVIQFFVDSSIEQQIPVVHSASGQSRLLDIRAK